jgi:flagellar L-ring protein precursor FlgH
VLPNGHLLVSGEKQIGVNENVDAALPGRSAFDPAGQFSGVCTDRQRAPRAQGRGAQAEAQVIGWLARFFKRSPI